MRASKLPEAPGLTTVLMRSLMANRHDFNRQLKEEDLLLVPPIPDDMGILDWHRHAELVENAYRWGLEEMARLKQRQPPDRSPAAHAPAGAPLVIDAAREAVDQDDARGDEADADDGGRVQRLLVEDPRRYADEDDAHARPHGVGDADGDGAQRQRQEVERRSRSRR